MPDAIAALRDALRAVVVRPPHSFSWFGTAVSSPPSMRRGLSPDHLRLDLEERLALTLYASFYRRGSAGPIVPPEGPLRPDDRFVRSLSRANRGSGCDDPGWRTVRRHASGAVFTKRGLSFTVSAAGAPNGTTIALPKELPCIAPGFYTALGDAVPRPNDAIVRVYWNVEAGGAARLVTALTRSLNEHGVPFRFKIANHSAAFGRCDAAVLYARRADAARLWGLLGAIRRDLRSRLGVAVPAFTKAIAPGVAVAEDPARGESFGMHRCRIVAGALVRSALRRRTGIDDMLREIEAVFAEQGLDLARPYLNAGSRDRYPAMTP